MQSPLFRWDGFYRMHQSDLVGLGFKDSFNESYVLKTGIGSAWTGAVTHESLLYEQTQTSIATYDAIILQLLFHRLEYIGVY